ncbi:SDR family oxidoreductase, partial [bacterium]|nr:SDR family oxidoreductase [bacterium]
MLKRQKGAIVNIASMWGETGASCESHYAASKAAMINLTKSLAKELGLSGIRVNCVSPGVIDTKMNSYLDEETLKSLKKQSALNMLGTPEDVAEAVSFFSSQKSKFITGQILGVNGGFLI